MANPAPGSEMRRVQEKARGARSPARKRLPMIGAARRAEGRRSRILPPMNATLRPFASYVAGEKYDYVRTVTEADVVDFARVSGDDNAIHLDEAFGRRTRFGGRVAHGALTFGFMAASQTQLVGAGIIWLGAAVRFTAPVRIGDTVTTRVEVLELVPEKRRVKLVTRCLNQRGEMVIDGEATVLVPDE